MDGHLGSQTKKVKSNELSVCPILVKRGHSLTPKVKLLSCKLSQLFSLYDWLKFQDASRTSAFL